MWAEYWPAIAFLSAIGIIAATILLLAWLCSRGSVRSVIRR